jgi:hypothetical protein
MGMETSIDGEGMERLTPASNRDYSQFTNRDPDLFFDSIAAIA